MRKLAWFTAGFGAASLICAQFWLSQGLYVAAVAVLLLAVAVGICVRWVKIARIPALFLAGLAVGFGWYQLYCDHYLDAAALLHEQEAYTTARCTDYSVESEYGCRVDCWIDLNGKGYRARLYLNADADVEPGDMLTGVFRFKVTTPDGDFDTTSYQGKGIFLIGYQREDVDLTKFVDTPMWAKPAILRHRLIENINTYFSEDISSFARALLVGDRSGIGEKTNADFQTSGIMHVIAVSGLHVTILFTLINIMCLKRRFLVALIGIPALAVFAVVGGFSPSVIRACIMQGLIILAMLFDREYDNFTELAFACLVMMVVNPLVITSVSFQLSVGCMLGIFFFQKPLNDWILSKIGKKGRLPSHIAQSLSMTLSAMTLTTPLSAMNFGVVSIIGPLTNLLTLWIISFVFYGVMLVATMGFLLPGIAGTIAWVVSWAIRYVLRVSTLCAGIPLAAVYTRSVYILGWLVLCYGLLAILLICKKKRPLLFGCCVSIGLILAVIASWAEPLLDDCRMTVLDVGQGQSIILQSDGKTYLVDCGGDYDSEAADLAAKTLLSQGISRLDGLILTHFDRDHAGGALQLLERISADQIFTPNYEDERGIGETLRQRYGSKVHGLTQDMILTYGDTEIRIFASVVPDSGNESSLAVLFQAGNCDILITGDRGAFGERILMKTAQLPDLEILVAGHHGSKTSTCEEFLRATTPEIVVISVGENNYGHPAQEVLDRLEKFGCAVYRTDIHGNLVFRR